MKEKLKLLSDHLYLLTTVSKLDSAYTGLVKNSNKVKRNVGLLLLSSLVFNGYLLLKLKNLEIRLDDRKEQRDIQDQLDSTEKKLLQLELELEDLRKKE